MPENRNQIGKRLGEQSFGPWEQPLAPDQGDFAGLLEAPLREAGRAGVNIEIDQGVDYEVVVELIAALTRAGIEDYTLQGLEGESD